MKPIIFALLLGSTACGGQQPACEPGSHLEHFDAVCSSDTLPRGQKCSERYFARPAQDLCVYDKTGRIAPPVPLKCGKYQHVERASPKIIWDSVTSRSGNEVCGGFHSEDGSFYVRNMCISENSCADDMHTLTEKEWQELMARLKALEARLKALEAR